MKPAVGTGIMIEEISRRSPTVPVTAVTVTSRVAELDGRFIRFDVSLSDGMDLIGEGRHQRALVQTARFQAKADAKARAAGVAG